MPCDRRPRGGERGFTGYTYKQKLASGRWRVTVETADGREIGGREFPCAKDDEPLTNRALTRTCGDMSRRN